MILDLVEIKRELVYFLRNASVFTVTQRGVTTVTETGTFTSANSHVINVLNVKNVRGITVNAVTLRYGHDYTLNVDYLDGTIKARIAFKTVQSGNYSLSYDYGADKIFPDFPKSDLTINSFPRIGCDVININTAPAGFGNVNVNTVDMTIVVYALKTMEIATYINTIRTAIIGAQTSFYYLGSVVKPYSVGSILLSPSDKGRTKVLQQNIDVRAYLNYEKN